MIEGTGEGATDGYEYATLLRAHYLRLSAERASGQRPAGFEEVKLRLFLSLLQPPASYAAETR